MSREDWFEARPGGGGCGALDFFAEILTNHNVNADSHMSEPFIGQIILFAGNFPPRGWAFCEGQLLSIAQNSALFSNVRLVESKQAIKSDLAIKSFSLTTKISYPKAPEEVEDPGVKKAG